MKFAKVSLFESMLWDSILSMIQTFQRVINLQSSYSEAITRNYWSFRASAEICANWIRSYSGHVHAISSENYLR